MTNTVVTGIKTLRRMAKAGLVKLHRDTGAKVKHWTGPTVTACYVDDLCDGVPSPFEFEKKHYRLKYFAGCFCPFVVCLENAEKHGIDLNKKLLA